MSEIVAPETSMKPLLDKMVAAKQLSATDAAILVRKIAKFVKSTNSAADGRSCS